MSRTPRNAGCHCNCCFRVRRLRDLTAHRDVPGFAVGPDRSSRREKTVSLFPDDLVHLRAREFDDKCAAHLLRLVAGKYGRGPIPRDAAEHLTRRGVALQRRISCLNVTKKLSRIRCLSFSWLVKAKKKDHEKQNHVSQR